MFHPTALARLALLVGLLLLGQTSLAEPPKTDRWRIDVNKDAASSGTAVFQVRAIGCGPTDVSVDVAEGTSENDVATAVRNALVAALPSDAYKVEISGGEKVDIEKRKGAADFTVLLVSSTIEKVEFEIKPK